MPFRLHYYYSYKPLWLIVCLLSLIAISSYAQYVEYDDHKHSTNLNFENYNLDKSTNVYIREIKIDKGVVWALTYDAIYKFNNGKFYKVYDLDSNISTQNADRIFIDKLGRVWLMNSETGSDLIIYDIRESSTISAQNIKSLKAYYKEIKSSKDIYNDSENNIWWKISETKFLKFSTQLELIELETEQNIIRLYEVNQTVFAHTEKGLFRIQENKLIPLFYTEASSVNISKGSSVDYIIYAHNSTKDTTEIYLLQNNLVQKKIVQELSDSNPVNDQHLYHESTNSLIRAYQSFFSINDYKNEIYYQVRMPFHPTSHSLYDNNGNIFMPTTTGVITISKKKYPFEIINKKQNKSYRHISVVRDSVLQCATYSGFEERNLHTGKIIHTLPDLISYSRSEIDSTKSVINKSHTKSLILVDKTTPVKSESGLLELPFQKSNINEPIRKVYYDKVDSTFWVAGLSNLWKLQLHNENSSIQIMENIHNVTEITRFNEHLIFSTNQGLYRISEKDNFDQIDLEASRPLCHILGQNQNKELFIAVQGVGIKVLNKQLDIKDEYNDKIGVLPTNIYSLQIDNNENIWAGTSQGILYIDRNSRQTKYFKYSDGVGQNDFNYQSSYKTDDGVMLFGGINRLVKFNPDSIIAANKNVDVKLIDAFARKREETTFNSVYNTTDLVLSLEKPELKLVFGYDNIADRSEGDLLYQLDNSEWRLLQNEEVIIKELSPGTHQLSVKHKYNDDKIFTTTIKSRYPLPGYFLIWLILLMGIASIIYLSSYIKRIRLEKANRQLEKQVALRTKEIKQTNKELKTSNDTKDKIFSVLAHDLRSPVNNLLDLTDTVNYLVSNNRSEELLTLGSEIQKKTNRLKTLIDNILHWSLQQQNKTFLIANNFKIIGPIENIIKLYSTLAEEKNILFKKKISPSTSITADYSAFELIMRNLIYNAIKYSYKGGTVTISSIIQGENLLVIVDDHGIGISREQIAAIKEGTYASKEGPYNEKGTGVGLILSMHYAKKMNGQITIAPVRLQGARVTLSLPVNAVDDVPHQKHT